MGNDRLVERWGMIGWWRDGKCVGLWRDGYWVGS